MNATVEETQSETRSQENGQATPVRVYTISDVIVGQREIEEALETLQQDAETLTKRLLRFDWYRRCHTAGFDLNRIIRTCNLFQVEGDFQAIDPEELERLMYRAATEGGCHWDAYNFRFAGKNGVRNRKLTDDERDCVIYFLANLHRLPKLTPDPAPVVTPVPQDTAEGLTPQAEALIVLRQILEWSVSAPAHRGLPDELFDRAGRALSLIDPFWDT
jgi:hypothetical protein